MSTITNGTYINMFEDMPFAVEIRETAADMGAEVYLVGGCVRDLIMGRPAGDVDAVPFGVDYEKFARALARRTGAFAVPFKDNVRLAKGQDVCDVSKPRGRGIEEDLMKRDFTINNLACGTDGKILGDPADIKDGVIRAVYPEAFDDDPLRILRGFRFAAGLGFSMEESTFRLAEAKSALLSSTASERITEELAKTLAGPYAPKALELLEKSRALKAVFPGAELDFASPARLERHSFPLAAALLAGNDAAKRLALSSRDEKTALYALKYFNEASEPEKKSLREKRAFLWKHLERAEGLLDFAAAKRPDKKEALKEWAKLLPGINAEKAGTINGEVLKKMGFPPGPIFGRIIEDTAEKLALDEIEESGIKNYIEKNYGAAR